MRGTIKGQQEVLHHIAQYWPERFVNRSNPTAAADEILRETGNYYLLAFYPEPYTPDGKFHRVQVKVTPAGVRVPHARRLSRAIIPHGIGEHERTGEAAIAAGSPVAELPLKAVATPIGWNDKGTITVVTAHMGSTEPLTAPDNLLFSMRALDSEGKIQAARIASCLLQKWVEERP